MNRNKESLKKIFLEVLIAVTTITIAGMNVRILIDSDDLKEIARKSSIKDTNIENVLKNDTSTSEETGTGIMGSKTNFSKALSKTKALAASATRLVTLDLNDGYYTQVKLNTTNLYNDGTSAAKVGTATSGDVLSGKTFTNSSTVGETGTMTNYGSEPAASAIYTYNNNLYMSLPDKNNPDPWPGGYIVGGIKYPLSNFGNVTAARVLSGKTFTSSAGLNLTGTMTNYGTEPTASSIYTSSYSSINCLYMGLPDRTSAKPFPEGYIVGGIKYPLSNFGDATAADVATGKTFTSSAGANVTGTGVGGTYAFGQKLTTNENLSAFGTTRGYKSLKINYTSGTATVTVYRYTTQGNHFGAVLGTLSPGQNITYKNEAIMLGIATGSGEANLWITVNL